MTPTSSALVLCFAAIITLAFIASGLLERVHALEQTVGLRPGTTPDRHRALPDHPAFRPTGRPLVAVVASPTCISCAGLVADLGQLTGSDLDVRVVWEDRAGTEVPDGVQTALITRQVALDAGATATPYVLVVDDSGSLRWSGAVADIERVLTITHAEFGLGVEGGQP